MQLGPWHRPLAESWSQRAAPRHGRRVRTATEAAATAAQVKLPNSKHAHAGSCQYVGFMHISKLEATAHAFQLGLGPVQSCRGSLELARGWAGTTCRAAPKGRAPWVWALKNVQDISVGLLDGFSGRGALFCGVTSMQGLRERAAACRACASARRNARLSAPPAPLPGRRLFWSSQERLCASNASSCWEWVSIQPRRAACAPLPLRMRGVQWGRQQRARHRRLRLKGMLPPVQKFCSVFCRPSSPSQHVVLPLLSHPDRVARPRLLGSCPTAVACACSLVSQPLFPRTVACQDLLAEGLNRCGQCCARAAAPARRALHAQRPTQHCTSRGSCRSAPPWIA